MPFVSSAGYTEILLLALVTFGIGAPAATGKLHRATGTMQMTMTASCGVHVPLSMAFR